MDARRIIERMVAALPPEEAAALREALDSSAGAVLGQLRAELLRARVTPIHDPAEHWAWREEPGA